MIVRTLENRWVQLILRLLLGAIFISAGEIKLRAPLPFADSIATFRLLPGELINLLAIGLPVLELTVGGLLVIGWLKRGAALAAVLMTGIFALALTSALARGLPVDCGCFGSGETSIYHGSISLGRDLFLGGMASVLYWWESIKTLH